mgnify:CR=1 FL=1
MIDEYVGRIVVCGKAANDEVKSKKVEDKVRQLYWAFYFGEENSPLER